MLMNGMSPASMICLSGKQFCGEAGWLRVELKPQKHVEQVFEPLQGSSCRCHIPQLDEQLRGQPERFPLQSCLPGNRRHHWTVHLHHQPEQST